MNKNYIIFIIVLYVFFGSVFVNTIISTSEANDLNVDIAKKESNILDKSCLVSFTSYKAKTGTQSFIIKQGQDNIIWQTSKEDAAALAQSEGKKILLLAGRETCGNTTYMRDTVCESDSPSIRSFIDQYYIPWFCDVDSDKSFWAYAQGLGSIILPFISIIDPNDIDNYIDRSTSIQYPDVFFNRIQMAIFPPDSFLTVTPSFREVSALSGITNFSVANIYTGTMNWEVIENVGWLSVSPVSGVNDLTVTVIYDENTSVKRKAILTIEAEYAKNSPFQFEIIQAPSPNCLLWETSIENAIEMAKNEGKKILLLAGRETCGNTIYMRDTVCELTNPSIKQLISDNFIPWYCDVDNSTEYYNFAQNLGGFTLPLICTINPYDSTNYIDRSTATQTPNDFYNRIVNITNQDIVPGDFNNDNITDLQDIILSLHILINDKLPSKQYLKSDINGNGKIELSESIFLFQLVSEIRKSN